MNRGLSWLYVLGIMYWRKAQERRRGKEDAKTRFVTD